MLCLACAERPGRPLCLGCARDLEPGPTTHLPAGMVVVAAYRHRGAARRLVHRLKYQGLTAGADVLGAAMARSVPAAATALVPVPRAWSRRLRTGVDPARQLAARVGALTGLPVIDALEAGWWWGHHAGTPRRARSEARFRPLRPIPFGAVLVDDVVTSGATLVAARAVLGRHVRLGLAATSPGTLRVRGEDDDPDAGEDAWRRSRTENRLRGTPSRT